MGLEIERKFLLASDDWRNFADEGTLIKQGYLNSNPERTTRVRTKGKHAFITIKGKNEGITRQEFEYEIPVFDAEQLLNLCEQPIIEKVRYLVTLDGLIWEIDVFEGVNAGLILAEVELKSEDQVFSPPAWIGKEVSGDIRYYNSNLIKEPFLNW